jgi:hypothetical protein
MFYIKSKKICRYSLLVLPWSFIPLDQVFLFDPPINPNCICLLVTKDCSKAQFANLYRSLLMPVMPIVAVMMVLFLYIKVRDIGEIYLARIYVLLANRKLLPDGYDPLA